MTAAPARVVRADCLPWLMGLSEKIADGICTDPPYSSGGQYRGDRAQSTRTKYVNSDAVDPAPDFTGDNRDQRAYLAWCSLWLAECLRVSKPGAVCMLFTDWRQLPTTTDALQAGGWVWRGVVPWYKPLARPQSGRFTAACEYVVWGTNGQRTIDGECFPGFYQYPPPRDREHQTQKPLGLMSDLLQIIPEGGLVLDPFAGSGATGVAAAQTGREFLGCELDSRFAEVAAERVAEAYGGPPRPKNPAQGFLL